MQRRAFLAAAGAGAACLWARTGAWAAPAASAAARATLLLDEPIATIAPEIYGHFTEHLGGVIYGGVWVGETSPIPNLGGIRRALVEKMRAIRAPVIRWPGGCFADSYDWRDGVGPVARRPTRTNFWAGSVRGPGGVDPRFDPNRFGTAEFCRFCQLCGARPYLAANVRSLPPLVFDQWVEYCNAPAASTTWARVRAGDGSAEPFGVRYWGIGNESWGCGGNFTPAEYAAEYRRFTAWVPRYGVPLQFVASGPNADDVGWTTGFFENILGRRPVAPPFGWSVHNYTFGGAALRFTPEQAYAEFARGYSTEKVLRDHWAAMGEFDRKRRVKLVVDEYGAWHRGGTAPAPEDTFGQQITMQDAILTAFTLDIFNRNADKVALAACAQLINCINSLFLARGTEFLTTPNYHVFDLYAAHQGAQAVRAEFAAPAIHFGRGQSFWGLNGSASRQGSGVTLTLVNPSQSTAAETVVEVPGTGVRAAEARVLTGPGIHAHNTFAHPDAVTPRPLAAALDAGRVRCTLPPASVTALRMSL
jgi:alpha-N-arabinofuranosidase